MQDPSESLPGSVGRGNHPAKDSWANADLQAQWYSLPQQDPPSSRSALGETGLTHEEVIGRMMQHQHLPIVRAALEQIAFQRGGG